MAAPQARSHRYVSLTIYRNIYPVFGCFLITYLCQDCLWPVIAIHALYFGARRVESSQLLPMANAHAIVPYVAAKAAPRPHVRGGPYARLVDVAPTVVAVPQFLIALRDIPDGAPLPRATAAIITRWASI